MARTMALRRASPAQEARDGRRIPGVQGRGGPGVPRVHGPGGLTREGAPTRRGGRLERRAAGGLPGDVAAGLPDLDREGTGDGVVGPPARQGRLHPAGRQRGRGARPGGGGAVRGRRGGRLRRGHGRKRTPGGRLSGTLYNTIVYVGADGRLLGKHRKLIPTYAERLIWGQGDGSTLGAFDSSVGRVGGLVCWEHWMPLARHAMHVAGEQVHAALWPAVEEIHQVASRHYAFEARCFVVAVGSVLRRDQVPADLEIFRGDGIDPQPRVPA